MPSTPRLYLKTAKLEPVFKGQRAIIVDVLSNSSAPIGLDEIVPEVDKRGRYRALLNSWAAANGGVRGSIQFHLRALKKLGMIEEHCCASTARARVVRWGNSQAVRIPRAILDQVRVRQGEELEIVVENGRIALVPTNPKLTLESLVAAITPENRHDKTGWGPPVGNEIW
jgi:antitoxin MazE